MGNAQNCFPWIRSRNIIMYILILLASTSRWVQLNYIAEGRVIPNLVDASSQNVMSEHRRIFLSRTQIGSTPPRCDRRCEACSHCQAVQVPVSFQVQGQMRYHFSAAASSTACLRGDDISNYKPISWKCKCGDFFFNP